MTMAGACMLWVGWFGFNAGSALKAGGDAGMAMTVTHISAATAALVWLAIESVKFGKPSVVGIVTGAVAGLATITPASGFVGPVGALIIGLAGGMICYGMVVLVKKRFRIDDSLDVFAVHGVGGPSAFYSRPSSSTPRSAAQVSPRGAASRISSAFSSLESLPSCYGRWY